MRRERQWQGPNGGIDDAKSNNAISGVCFVYLHYGHDVSELPSTSTHTLGGCLRRKRMNERNARAYSNRYKSNCILNVDTYRPTGRFIIIITIIETRARRSAPTLAGAISIHTHTHTQHRRDQMANSSAVYSVNSCKHHAVAVDVIAAVSICSHGCCAEQQ